MRKTIRATMTAMGLMALASGASAQGPLKIAYVNTQALMAAAPGRLAADSAFGREVTAFQKQQQVWQDSLRKQYEGYQKAEPTLTAAKKQSEQERITKLQQDLGNLNTLGEAKLQQRQNELLAPITEVVRSAIEEIRTEGGYAMIFSGDDNTSIVAADKNLDITDRVVARLKTKAATKPAAPSAMGPAGVKKPPTE
jgi:outer membrane protein